MIKNNKLKMLISSLIILLPSLIGKAFIKAEIYDTLFFPILFPLILLVIHWLCIFITGLDKKNIEQHKKVLGIAYWIIPTISVFVSAVMYLAVSGFEDNISLIIGIMVGLGFILIGNVMPKSRRNRTIGIKIKWTLENDENWNATHRFGGKVWVAGGALITVLAFLPEMIFFCIFFVILAVSVILPVVYSYIFYKKQVREGRYEKDDSCSFKASHTKLGIALTSVFVAAVFAICGFMMFTGDITASFTEDAVVIETSYYNGYSISYSEIESVELRDDVKAGNRVAGFASAKLLMGNFKNEEFGKYIRYTYSDCELSVVVVANGKTVVINGEDEVKTRSIYEMILRNTEK